MTNPGRPTIGNPIHVRVGDLLDAIDQFGADNGHKTRPDATRELIRLGLHAAGGRRVLYSDWQRTAATTPGPEGQVYRDAADDGDILRYTGNGDLDEIKLISYTDPHDETPRYAVRVDQLNEGEMVDYTDRAAAEGAYEEKAREQGEAGWTYEETDVA